MAEKIAIVGLSCLFPGAATPDEFWQNLLAGKNMTSPATGEQWGVEPTIYHDPLRRKHDTSYFQRGGYISGFNSGELAGLDNVFKWSLYVAREALKDAGYLNRADILRACGLILGNLSFPTRLSHQLVAQLYDQPLSGAIAELLNINGFKLPRHSNAQIDLRNALISGQPAAVVASLLGLGGTHFALDAACASSLYAVGFACDYLASGRADMMLAGAVSAADPLFINMGFTHFGAYPEKGDSRPLDATSEGLVAGEGAGMLVLKRHSDALRDGDKIYALIGGVGLSNDGRGKHPLTPNPRGQILAFQRAYNEGVNPAHIQYVECHASGTPLGDKTELNSLDEFFGPHGVAPMIGSVKANLGHLLTVAGLASMLKVILSMAHGQIPATVNVQRPLVSHNQIFGQNQIVSQTTQWPSGEKRAGVNAFGFGGVSAHLVLEQTAAQPQTSEKPQPTQTKMAIIGMDAQFGAVDGIADFAQTLYDGTQHFSDLPVKRWRGLSNDAPQGAYLESFEIDFMRFKFPPKEDEQPIPQQLLLLKVADNALQDSGVAEGSNVAVIVALGTELSLHQYRERLDLSWQIKDGLQNAGISLPQQQVETLEHITKDALNPPAQVNQYTSAIGNIISSRVSALWDFTGPAFTVSAEENSVFKALEVAQLLLEDESVDAVVVGAVDLSGGVENVLLRSQMHPISDKAPTLGFDQNSGGWLIGEGAGAVVLKRADKVKNERVYAVIESVALAQNDVKAAAEKALNIAGVDAREIGYLEVHASGITGEDSAEITGIHQVYNHGEKLHTALGSVKANVGHTFAASGIASLIKTALTLYNRFIPAVPGWTAPKQPDVWQNSPFYVAQESRTWLSRSKRYSAISGLGADGAAAHVVLSEGHHNRNTDYLKRKPLHLFLIDADNKAGLIGRLGQLEEALKGTDSLATIASRTFNVYRNRPYVAALVAKNRETLRKEIEAARKGISEAIDKGGEWLTPAGSYFTARPLGDKGGVAFVYPGAFNSYPGLGQDWMHLFPTSHDHLLTLTTDAPTQVADKLLYQRSIAAPSRAEVRAFRSLLGNDQIAMMESGTTFAVLFTNVVREVFKIKPSAAFGYSIGEGSMLWAMGVWYDGDTASRVFHASPLFRNRLFGRKEAVREMWGLPDNVSDDFWASYVLTATLPDVLNAMASESRVYVTHVNTPQEVVIAGEPAACERVIAAIGCNYLKAPFEVVIHNEAMISEYDEFYRLHNHPLTGTKQDVTFYSAADYQPIHLERDAIARNIARVSCKQVDFPRLINRAYRDGARIFIELGPGSTCARWVSDTLAEREHLAVSIDNLRSDDHTALIKMLARLASHRTPMDLSPLYLPVAETSERRSLMKTIVLGGEPVRDAILSAENRRRFAGGVAVQTPIPTAVIEAHPEPVAAYAAPVVAENGSTMQSRLTGLREIGAAISAQMRNPSTQQPIPQPTPLQVEEKTKFVPRIFIPKEQFTPKPAIFDTWKIDQFARGSIRACFGDEYGIYDNRRAPRIPNTDLMLVSRAIEINAERIKTKVGSSLVMEYDVPVMEWFYRDNPYPMTPYSVLMEMALQPCGFLSAYMGPTFDFPDIDFYFRNLDGMATLIREVDLRGRTLTNRVELLNSTTLQGIIIQKYSFDMMLDGNSFYTGSSTFGYFTLQALSSQAGLDMGKPPKKWHEANPDAPLTLVPANRQQIPAGETFFELPREQLAFLDDAQINLTGGKKGLGYIYGRTKVDPADWFFRCHFHQDPVMPGSLGLESISQAIQLYAIQANLGAGLKAPRFGHIEDHKMVWKYRGQVLSETPETNCEVQITSVERVNGQVNIKADASLWKGDLRIYEFKDVAVAIKEG